MKKTVIILFVLLSSIVCRAQKDTSSTVLLVGRGHSYYLTAPKGWVVDDEIAHDEGIKAVFFPKGESWAGAETAMYTNWAAFDTTKIEKVTDIINKDIQNFKKNSPGMIIKKEKVFFINKQKQVIVYSFINTAENFFEQVAYIEEKKGVVLIILTSTSSAGLEKNKIRFDELIKSYKFLTEKVNIH